MADDKGSQWLEIFNAIVNGRMAATVLLVTSGAYLLGWRYAPNWMQSEHLEFPTGWGWVPFVICVACAAVLAINVGLWAVSGLGYLYWRMKQREPMTEHEFLVMKFCFDRGGNANLHMLAQHHGAHKVLLRHAADSLRRKGFLEPVFMDGDYVVLSAEGRGHISKQVQRSSAASN